jgi:peptidoglycan/LPS O-acetylase OafA/YrhL
LTNTTLASLDRAASPAAISVRPRRLMKLEAVRGFAAVYVVLCHAHLSERPEIRLLFSFGQEAVILFFLLSGFVIYHASHRGRTLLSFGTYLNHRFRRIYPTFLVALALGYLASAVGEPRPSGLGLLLGNLAMLQDTAGLKDGVWFDVYAGNDPLWSLSYEWWFYMMFYPIMWLLVRSPERQRRLVFLLSVFGILAYQAFPNQISLFLGYFFVWWAGVELSCEYKASGTITWLRQLPTILMLACLVVLWGIPVGLAVSRGEHLILGVGPVLQLRHATAAVAFLIGGIAWYHAGFVGFRWLLGPFAVFAPISYALYAIHLPVKRILVSCFGASPLLILVGGLLVLLPACYLLEVVFQRRINRWFDRFLTPSVDAFPEPLRQMI